MPHARRSTTTTEVVHNLPSWLRGIAYRFDDDTVVLKLADESTREATPTEARAILHALKLCVEASERAAQVIEIPTDD